MRDPTTKQTLQSLKIIIIMVLIIQGMTGCEVRRQRKKKLELAKYVVYVCDIFWERERERWSPYGI